MDGGVGEATGVSCACRGVASAWVSLPFPRTEQAAAATASSAIPTAGNTERRDIGANFIGTHGRELRCGMRFFRLCVVVRPERFELPTSWFVARRSIQLSYGRTCKPNTGNPERAELRMASKACCSSTSPARLTRNDYQRSRAIGGEGGIRTLDGLLTHTPLAGARLRPLGHLSGRAPGPHQGARDDTRAKRSR
jgi:hypothetical protein